MRDGVLSVFSDNPCLETEQFAEVSQMPLVVAVEEDLVEAGETQDVLVAIELDPYRDDASTSWRDADIIEDGPGRYQDAGYLTVLVQPVARGQHINAGDTLALSPDSAGHSVSVTMVMGQVERLRSRIKTIQTCRA